jgi:DUF971 family protein
VNKAPRPTEIILHQGGKTLEIHFDDGMNFFLPWEYLRVFSPSAEVRGRRGRGRLLVRDKQQVVVTEVRPIGNYAVKLFFDDGHNSGLYDWRYLYQLGVNQEAYWSEHLELLKAADQPS